MKRLKLIFILLITALLVFRGIMVYTTNDLFDYVQKVMMNQIPNEETVGKPINVYQNTSEYHIDIVEAKIDKLWIFHNFKKGTAFVYYEFYQYSNGKIIFGASAFSKWLIERVDGKWEIVKIIEKP